MNDSLPAKMIFYAIVVWILAALFFFFEFFLRVFLGTISNEIIQDFHLSAESFSALGAGYYFTYSAMQIPVGILVDRYGVRLLLTLACGICTASVFWFVIARSFFPLFLSRLLMGFGSSFAFVGLLFISLNWFGKKHFGFFTGLSQLLGGVGPFLAGAPLALLIMYFDNNWRLIMLLIACFGTALTILIGLFIRNKPEGQEKKMIYLKPSTPLLKRLAELLSKMQIYYIIFFAALIYATLPLMGAYWGTFYLQSRGFIKSDAALIVSMIWLGLSLGSPIIGKISDSIKRRKPPLYCFSIIGCVASLLILYLQTNNFWLLLLLFFLLGIASSAQSLSFAVIADNVSDELKATALGLNNAMIVLFGALVPMLAGYLLMEFSISSQTYSLAAFQVSLSIMPILYLLALLLSLFLIKETFCRQQQSVHHIKKQDLDN